MAGKPDIIVVGAGVIGCAIAFELSRRGAAVRVVDDRLPGMGATQASAGILAPYIEARDGSPLLSLTVRSLQLFDDFVARAAAVSGVNVGYRRTGTLDVALQDETLRHFIAKAETLARDGVPVDVLDGKASRSAEPHLSDGVLGGLLIPSHGFVSASDLTRALSSGAVKQGATIEQTGRVRRISSVGGELILETGDRTLKGERVVIAPGSWAGQIEIDGLANRLPVRPVRGQLLQLGWNGTPIQRATWSERCYLVPWENGTLLVGATVEEAGFNERTTTAGVRELIESACELVPHAWTASLIAARAGLRPATPDEVPMIGPSRHFAGMFYATGHYRNGVLLSALTAQLAADALLENRLDPLLALTNPQRFGEF